VLRQFWENDSPIDDEFDGHGFKKEMIEANKPITIIFSTPNTSGAAVQVRSNPEFIANMQN
jgi:hypothetical protein